MLGKYNRPLGLLAFRPEEVSPSLVMGVALAPPVATGLLLHRLAAVEALVVAVAVGAVVHVVAGLAKQPLIDSPVVAAVVGVALVGPASPFALIVAVAAAGALIEPARARFVPGLKVQAGLLAYGAVLLAGRGAVAAYWRPGTTVAFAEPIRLWHDFYGGPAAPIDPVRLYVGNVPGPLFATSLLAVVVGMAWFWYAHRLSVVVVASALVGSLAPVLYLGWSPVYQLASGPLWFCVGLLLADLRNLPHSALGRPLLGLCAGALTMAGRYRGYGIEVAPLAVAALQLVAAGVDGAAWLRHRWRSPGRGQAARSHPSEPTARSA